jgi:hypothetical protein
MAEKKKIKKVKKQATKKTTRRTTSKDVPGTGSAKRAAKAIEDRNKRMKKMLNSI